MKNARSNRPRISRNLRVYLLQKPSGCTNIKPSACWLANGAIAKAHAARRPGAIVSIHRGTTSRIPQHTQHQKNQSSHYSPVANTSPLPTSQSKPNAQPPLLQTNLSVANKQKQIKMSTALSLGVPQGVFR